MIKSSKFGIAASLLFGMATASFAQDFCNAAGYSGTSKKVDINVAVNSSKGETNTIGDYHYEEWTKSGNGTATFYSDGSFTCTFTLVDDYLCREGLFYGKNSGKNPLNVGHIYADYSIAEFKNNGGISYAYAGIYGWMENPLIEWYIVDSWGPASRPNWLGTKRGEATIDGAKYEFYTASVNRGNINGSGPFDQIYSLRTSARTCGTIDITAHFEAWEKAGITLGKSLYEAKVLGEAGQYPEFVPSNASETPGNGASGSIKFNYAKVYIDNNGTTPSVSSSSTSSGTVTPGTPYSSNSVPGKIEFENFDIGGYDVEDEADGDGSSGYRESTPVDIIGTGTGNGVGYIQPNDWLEYTVDVTKPAYYKLSMRGVSGADADRTVTFLVDGKDWNSISFPTIADNWSDFSEASAETSAPLTAGSHVIRVVFDGYINVDWFELTADGELEIESSSSAATEGLSSSANASVSSSSAAPLNSSASNPGDSNNPTSSESSLKIANSIHMLNFAKDFQVFDLQGKFLGNINMRNGGSINQTLKMEYKKSGIYIIKQGSYMQRINVK